MTLTRRKRSISRHDLILGLALLGLLAVGIERLFEPATWVLARAVRDLGPISGWRCANSTTYVYDPRRDRPDAQLLAEAPEDMLRVAVPEVTVERVEADLKGGDTVVWSRVGAADQGVADQGVADQGGQVPYDEGERRRVYVLSPGRKQAITLETADARTSICQSHLGDWQIVAEHALG